MGKRESRTDGRGGEGEDGKERIARRRYIMSGISRKIVSGARTAKMSVRGKGDGGARGRPNKYLTKSSGKLIPSLGRLLRCPTFSRSAVDDAPERVDGTRYRSSPRFSSCDFASGIGEAPGNHVPPKR